MVDKTRTGQLSQKKGVSVAVIPFVEADILLAGSKYVNLPKRSLITKVVSIVTTTSGTANSTVDVIVNGATLVDELAVAAAGVTNEALVATAQYLATGGAVEIRAGAVTPADGALVGELVISYIELDKNCGEYTTITNS